MKINERELATRIAAEIHSYRGGGSTERRKTAGKVQTQLRNTLRFEHVIKPKIESAFPWIIERPATETDFKEFCASENITVIYDKAIESGVYVLFNDESFIFLNPQLTGRSLRFVMFHEAAHYLFHDPRICFEDESRRQQQFSAKKHIEADIVSALLIAPAQR